MASIEFGTITFDELLNAQVEGEYSAGRYWYGSVVLATPMYDRRKIVFPGVDGTFIKKMGFRGYMVTAPVMYIGASLEATMSDQEEDAMELANTVFDTVSPSGTTYRDCQLTEFAAGQVMHTPDAQYIMMTSITVTALKLGD